MFGKKSISALKLPHLKGTSGKESVRIAPPPEVLLPTTMHPGGPAVPVVEVGDHVLVGQLIAREEGKNSSPVHATVSGTVVAIEPYGKDVAIRIESDGKMEKDPSIQPPVANDLDEFLKAVRDSGIVGLGGAAFPLWAKLDAVRKNPIPTVLVNGAECEPYITSDDRMMVEHSDYVQKGIELLKKYLNSTEFIIGIEKNKEEAIAKLTAVFADDPAVKVMPLESVYPQGAKQVLLYNATGKVVGEGQRLASLGVIIINVSSLAKMAEFFETGMPLVEKTITLDGTAVKEPKNVTLPIGTRISYAIEQAGGLSAEPGKIIYGGPMMGKTTNSVDNPILKATNAVTILKKEDCVKVDASPCLHCGRCVANCPLGLNPTGFSHAMEIEDEEERYDALCKLKVQLCMECGSCTYVCPANRPLASTNHEAKGFVRKMKTAKDEAKKAAAEKAAAEKAAAEAAQEGGK